MSARQVTRINPKGFHRSQLKIYAYLLPLAIFMLLPILYILNHAFKPVNELFAFPPRFFVEHPTLENFRKLFQATQQSGIPIGRYVFNSIVVTVLVVFLTVLISTMAGFALSKLKFKGKNVLFEINTLALMFVPVAVMIPRYLTIDKLHIMDTYLAHILPLLSMPVGLFLIKQFIDQVPDELIEAAVVDGASIYKIYYKIIIPMIRPAIATVAILSFQSVWNNTETSTLFVTQESMRTLAFFMNSLSSNTNVVAGQGIAAAAGLIMFIPNIVLFIILQSNVMNTMAYSGMK
ncbi:carbohydrate ABC transporter permease [Clostridium thermosuccinogenes]|jgi:ABC-type glycerol-3-phosphate transport system permease component|uniref:carbohydrate ABC transporter permease n=1 Tax=Clostridium thermosuccinogenes TaxID=84032 RepID=UPI000CCC0DCF|nr:carbohydrate ABC transporter permease [Pseudoclostridium thermosuccinogenes]PNT90545.1 ABC transporter permease [Pseudoclostridium thermosuccinogenes]